GGRGVGLPPSLDLVEQLEVAAHDQLEAAAEGFRGVAGAPEIATAAPIGSASSVLLAASETADMVVIGSRGHGGFGSTGV
ncbi:MAG: universal stress protein, partial [Phycisphaerales bacterium]